MSLSGWSLWQGLQPTSRGAFYSLCLRTSKRRPRIFPEFKNSKMFTMYCYIQHAQTSIYVARHRSIATLSPYWSEPPSILFLSCLFFLQVIQLSINLAVLNSCKLQACQWNNISYLLIYWLAASQWLLSTLSPSKRLTLLSACNFIPPFYWCIPFRLVHFRAGEAADALSPEPHSHPF